METTAEKVDSFGVTEKEQMFFNRRNFTEELETLINRFSIENKSNTPDFILATFMIRCLNAFEATSRNREKWFGVSLDVARGWEEKVMQAIGEASMCWSETPKGVFDSEAAAKIGDELVKYLRNCEK